MERSPPRLVFLGPTLPRAQAEDICDAIYLPPAAQGSIVTAVERHAPCAILIIDGIFQSEPAVRHKEILWAMARGITVLGAASMGALRAAELDRHGMLGVGLIYRWYRRFAFAPDDAVAVLHMPEEIGSAAMTLSLIDLLMTFRRAERRGLIDRSARSRLDIAARKLNYRERTLAQVAKTAGLASDCAVLEQHLVEQKRKDAVLGLATLAKVNMQPAPRCADFTWTTAFMRDLRHANITLPGDR
ncbi:MAG: TfuA-like protein [Parvibaculaceae bacterium]